MHKVLISFKLTNKKIVLSNFYEILGLKIGAERLEIKSAFRRLAKLYHPDKNNKEKEKFSLILKAYKTLSDNRLRLIYDSRLNQSSNQYNETLNKKTPNKNWKFDEKELKRRQYYNDYIKKHEKYIKPISKTEPLKSSYNEYKYILFATPLAVALFLLIMQLAIPENSLPNKTVNPKQNINSAINSASVNPIKDTINSKKH